MPSALDFTLFKLLEQLIVVCSWPVLIYYRLLVIIECLHATKHHFDK